ncbi:MAG: YggS family pyridoxal phosphate-dependent enzyme [Bdellovibrionaceae bacterium]|nr:YggS family pyridoxal phosphate-dependent enzyme [Pseudobdellovibrionaceae bacterium]
MLNRLQQKLKPSQNILAVSKLQPLDKIEKLYAEGQTDFGENYVQEALGKIEHLKHLKIHWHLIGPIQSNKIKYLKDHFEFIHSVDSLKTAQIISTQAEKIRHIQKIFLQVNISNESSKSGFSIEQLLKDWTELGLMKNIKVVGLMTMPPLQNEAEQNRPLFKTLKKLADQLQLSELSMGTSHDYETALEEGATWVRLGTVLFGERTK